MASIASMKNYIQRFHFLMGRNNVFKNRSFHTSLPINVINITMPSLSPTMSEGTIVTWLKKEGEVVNPGDILCEIQTDKAVVALETEDEGVLAEILMGNDSKDVKIGSLIGLLAEPGEEWKAVKQAAQQARSTAASGAQNETQNLVQTNTVPIVFHGSDKSTKERIGPAVRGLLEKYGLSASAIAGSGPRGFLLKGDILSHIAKEKLSPNTCPPAAQPSVSLESSKRGKSSSTKTPKSVVKDADELNYLDVDLSNMRRTIAKRLTQSKTGIPHAYSTVSCYMDSVVKLRKMLKSEGIEVSMNDFIIKAVATALAACPEANVIWKGDQLVQPSSIDISVAVATSSGLITPIVTDVALRGLQDIGKIVRDLADRARAGKLQLHEFQGGSFTISNLGMFGINEFSAIINPPQCAILAVGGSRLILSDDGKPVTMMNATLSYDQSAISSVAAATFMATLQNLLESPENIILGKCVHPHPLYKNDDNAVGL